MVFTRPSTSKSSSPLNNPLVSVLKSAIMIGISVTFMLHSFFQFSTKFEAFILLFSFFQFILWSPEIAQFTILQVLFFLLIIISSGLLAEIRWSVCMSMSHRGLCVSFSKTDAGLCIHQFFIWSNLNFLNISQKINLPALPYLVLYSFCANLLHSLMWLMVYYYCFYSFRVFHISVWVTASLLKSKGLVSGF